jgi:hypothetical protein
VDERNPISFKRRLKTVLIAYALRRGLQGVTRVTAAKKFIDINRNPLYIYHKYLILKQKPSK